MKKMILFLLLGSFLLFSNEENVKELTLEQLGLYKCPMESELNSNFLTQDLLDVSAIDTGNINQDFSNIEDLAWLKDIAREKKVVMVGELHYYHSIFNIRDRIFYALNTYDYFPVLILEEPYSLTGFVDHYIKLEDDNEAEKFYQNYIFEFIKLEENLELYRNIRRWNKTHPDKQLTVAFSDIEHHPRETIARILIPYFKKFDPDFGEIDIYKCSYEDQKEVFELFTEIQEAAAVCNIIGDFPFITPQYISNILNNLKSYYDYRDFDNSNAISHYRQKGIIRNLTDEKYLGKYLINNKVMLHGGAYHFPTGIKYPDNRNYMRDGSYLTYEFEPTKNKTYSIFIYPFFYSLGKMKNYEEKDCLFKSNNYYKILGKLNKAYQNNLIDVDDHVWEFKPTYFQKLFIKASYDNGKKAVKIDNIDWDAFSEVTKENDPGLYNSIPGILDFYTEYDKYIYLPYSPLMISIKKK